MGDERILATFIKDGRLVLMPTKRSKRLVVLDYLSQQFEPGRTYTEAEVSQTLETFHHDYAALRRYLVDEGFLAREANTYWRAGGSFDV